MQRKLRTRFLSRTRESVSYTTGPFSANIPRGVAGRIEIQRKRVNVCALPCVSVARVRAEYRNNSTRGTRANASIRHERMYDTSRVKKNKSQRQRPYNPGYIGRPDFPKPLQLDENLTRLYRGKSGATPNFLRATLPRRAIRLLQAEESLHEFYIGGRRRTIIKF